MQEPIGRSTFSFEARLGKSAAQVVYCSAFASEAAIAEEIEEILRFAWPSDELLLMVPEPHKSRRHVFLRENSGLRAALDGGAGPPLKCRFLPIYGDGIGSVRTGDGGDGASEMGDGDEARRLFEDLRREGLRRIFAVRRGFLEAGPNFHYISPSGRHTTKFLRIGNLLLRGVETEFIAAGLLDRVRADIKHIYTDTATINPVAHSLVALRRALGPDDDYHATVDSFSCFSSIETYDWADPARSLCLISASTSGGLASRAITRASISAERVVTLFFGGEAETQGAVLCDLHRLRDKTSYESSPRSYVSAAECAWCGDGQPAVRISGDQFLPARPDVAPVLVRAVHRPDWFASGLDLVVGRNVVSCFASVRSGEPETLCLDFSATLQQPESPFRRRIEASLRTFLPASLDRIVHSDDPASRTLAEIIGARYERSTGVPFDTGNVVPVPAVLADQDALGTVSPAGAILVVTAGTRSGRELLSVSQALRSRGVAAIAYLAACTYLPTAERWSEVRSSLAMGQRSGEHPVEVALTLEVAETERDPWADELRLWTQLVEAGPAPVDEGVVRDRCRQLEDARGSAGLTDAVFLPSAQGEPLSVQPGFVFYRGLPESDPRRTQADVFFAVAAVLHGLRQRTVGDDSLRQFEHSRRVLSPMNFRRYNDGAIQAAFLRAASHDELDYRNDSQLSQQMKDVMVNVASAVDRPEGQAALEFLLALATGRVSMVDEHVGEVCDAYMQSGGGAAMRPMIEALVAEVQQLRRRPVIAAEAP